MTKSKIEWTDRVWNPVTGCTKVSQGCKNCYAERHAKRFWGERKFTDVICHEDRLRQPMSWKKPCMVFVNSMSDLFHEDVPFDFIEKAMDVMYLQTHHTFQILTKRPFRALEYFSGYHGWTHPAENIWIGVSIEDQKTANERIPYLLQIAADVRFVSYEPALGPVNLNRIQFRDMSQKIDWVICGGESGPKARAMHPDWARWVRDDCQEAGIPFFFKQWGEWVDIQNGYEQINAAKNVKQVELGSGYWNQTTMYRVGKKAAGRLLDGRKWEEMPVI